MAIERAWTRLRNGWSGNSVCARDGEAAASARRKHGSMARRMGEAIPTALLGQEATTTLPPMAPTPGERFTGLRRIAVATACLLSSAALAFVMPSFSILRHMTNARDDLALYSVRVDGLASFHGSAVREAGAALGLPSDRPELLTDASFAMKLPGRCRMELTPLEGNRAAS